MMQSGRKQKTPAREVIWVFAVLVAWNGVANLVEARIAAWVTAAAGLAALTAIARHARLSRYDLGLGTGSLRSGVRWGISGAAIITAIIALVAAVPAGREFLADSRFTDIESSEMLYETLARIPLVTALAEEFAFRGILLGLFLRTMSPGRAILISSAAFGLWHVLPGITALDTSSTDFSGPLASALAVAGQVIVTAAAGAAFAWLRLRSGSLATPVLAHWSLNTAAYLAGWLIVTNGWT